VRLTIPPPVVRVALAALETAVREDRLRLANELSTLADPLADIIVSSHLIHMCGLLSFQSASRTVA